jgi:hypothetical protein
MGTLNAFLFLGLCLAWRWRDRAAPVGAVVGVLVTLKLLCWPLALWLLMTRRYRATAWAVGSAVAMLGIGWVVGPIGPFTYGRMLAKLSAHEVWTSSGIQAILVHWSFSTATAQLLGLAAVAMLVVVTVRRSDRLVYSAMVVAMLVATPVVWHHYYLLAAAPLLLAPYGAQWFLILGWVSVAARDSYGISWKADSVVASIVLAAIALRLMADEAISMWKSGRKRRIPSVAYVATVLAVVGTCLCAAFDPAALGIVGTQTGLSVAETFIVFAVALAQPRVPSPQDQLLVAEND